MSVPAYAPPSIGPAGLTVASYQSILADNLQAFLNIYGPTQVVTPNAAVYQLLSILSLKAADCNLGLQLVYNQSSPATAVGAGLDRQLKMNGLARAAFTYSTTVLTLGGSTITPTTVTGGAAQDINGNLWVLPSTVIIPITGSINVAASCTTPGSITAAAGSITIINTPVNGWFTVTNAAAAVPGSPIETDSKARARQAVSVALPSVTALASTVAACLAVPGVTRVNPGVPTPGGPGSSIENPTGVTDSWGNPAHSISMVVENGTDAAVAQAIYGARSIGCFTNGTTTVTVTDANTSFTMNISFFRPTYVPIYISVSIHGYTGTPTTAVVAAVQTAIVNYLNALAIGETVAISAINYEAMAVNASLLGPAFGVQALTMGLTASPTGAVDLAMAHYYNVSQGVAANVVVTTV